MLLPYDLFELRRSAEEARRASKLSNIYHAGQSSIWDGREVLADLVAQHGKPQMEHGLRQALEPLFAVLLWGEYAAWRISAQLADRIEHLEGKMAASSQVHDEARHFYVLHDYMELVGMKARRPDRHAEAVLRMVLETDSLTHKLLGMQLLIESVALTLFHLLRRQRLEPVLTELLVYYEKDEARHVGLGIQFLPALFATMGRRQRAALVAFQLRIVFRELAGLKVLEPGLRRAGISAREVFEDAMARQERALETMLAEIDIHKRDAVGEGIRRIAIALADATFPPEPTSVFARARRVFRTLSVGSELGI